MCWVLLEGIYDRNHEVAAVGLNYEEQFVKAGGYDPIILRSKVYESMLGISIKMVRRGIVVFLFARLYIRIITGQIFHALSRMRGFPEIAGMLEGYMHKKTRTESHTLAHVHSLEMAKPIPVVLFLLILFLPNSTFKLSYGNIILCLEIEKEALISFKQSLKDPGNVLSSWNSSNCCNWKGVVCSNVTGNVHQLLLQGGAWSSNLQGKINPSLLQLKHIKYLDLSRNNFEEAIPSFIGSLTSLEYLNLSRAGFYGKIPPTIGNLSRLHTLSLGGYYSQSERMLDADSVEWLRGLSQLEHLNMNIVNLTKAAAHWTQVINTLLGKTRNFPVRLPGQR
ncbi:hypothetical protein ACS0TY_035943 [Phlomoides rotata]